MVVWWRRGGGVVVVVVVVVVDGVVCVFGPGWNIVYSLAPVSRACHPRDRSILSYRLCYPILCYPMQCDRVSCVWLSRRAASISSSSSSKQMQPFRAMVGDR